MDKLDIKSYVGGWVVGNFEPSIFRNSDIEVGIKFFKKGDREVSHAQNIATELTIISRGRVRIGNSFLSEGEILVIHPGEFADFEALTDGSLTCIKSPSLPTDKILE